MAKQVFQSIQDEIAALKKERNAIIMAHNYQLGEIQDIADFTGDSLKLAQEAAKTKADVIIFCGVHFMAETASIICPDKKVIVPDFDADCSLANMVKPGEIEGWKKEHPGGVVVCYINTPAVVKSVSDYCCTSSNAVKVVNHIPADKEILFVPDYFLGTYAKRQTGRKIQVWTGYCPSHALITAERIEEMKKEHPGAKFIMHPECGCLTKSMHLADGVLSTEGMVRYARESGAQEFIVATEIGILHRMRLDNPRKKFYPASEQSVCKYMKMNSLEKIVTALERLEPEVKVPPEMAKRARVCIDRMLAIS